MCSQLHTELCILTSVHSKFSINCAGWSSFSCCSCSVLQGSVLGAILFLLLCTAELLDSLDIVVQCGFVVHAYADDTQVYVYRTGTSAQGRHWQQLKSVACVAFCDVNVCAETRVDIADSMCSERDDMSLVRRPVAIESPIFTTQLGRRSTAVDSWLTCVPATFTWAGTATTLQLSH